MYEEALRINDQDYRIWGNLGAAYHWAPGAREKATPAFQKAIQEGEQALTVNPKDAETISRLSGYYAMIGEKEKAVSSFKKAIYLDDNSILAHYYLGNLYKDAGLIEQAVNEYKHVICIFETNPESKERLVGEVFTVKQLKEICTRNIELLALNQQKEEMGLSPLRS